MPIANQPPVPKQSLRQDSKLEILLRQRQSPSGPAHTLSPTFFSLQQSTSVSFPGKPVLGPPRLEEEWVFRAQSHLIVKYDRSKLTTFSWISFSAKCNWACPSLFFSLMDSGYFSTRYWITLKGAFYSMPSSEVADRILPWSWRSQGTAPPNTELCQGESGYSSMLCAAEDIRTCPVPRESRGTFPPSTESLLDDDCACMHRVEAAARSCPSPWWIQGPAPPCI